MRTHVVVALHEVVHHDLPVPVAHAPVGLLDGLVVLQVVDVDDGIESRVLARQGLRLAVEVHQHEALPHFVPELLERIVISVESGRLLHLRRPGEVPVKAERPQVIRALQHVGFPRTATHLHPAVRTVARQHPNLRMPVPGDHQRCAEDVDAVVTAGRRHLLDAAQRHPAVLEDLIDLGGVQLVAAVGLGRQRDRLVGRIDGTCRGQAGIVERHCCSSCLGRWLPQTLWALCCGSVSCP